MDKDKKNFLRIIHRYVPFLYSAAVILATLYVSLRMRSWGNLVFGFETGFIAAAFAVFYMIITFKTGKNYLVAKNKFLTYVSGISTYVFMYLSMSVLASDVILLFIKCFAPESYTGCFKIFGGICLAFTLVITIFGIYHKGKLKTVIYNFDEPKIEGGYRIILLSDLHIGYYIGKKELSEIRERVNMLEGDMVVIAGDIINAGNMAECDDPEGAAEEIAGFKSKEGTFACTGNHDPDLSDDDFMRFINRAGIKLLKDEIYCNGKFNLMGRNTRTKPRMSLTELCCAADDKLPLFIADHDPIAINEAADRGADLIMCGHTHKGQVFPLNMFVRLLYSKEEFYGFHKVKNTYAAVSSGAGYFSMPMRVGTDCEVVVIDINKKQ